MKKLFAQIGRGIARLFGRLIATLRKPKWRHGGFGLLLLCCVAAASVLLNIAVSELETTYGWQRDFSFNGYATTGSETQKALDSLQHDVTLYLLYQGGDMDEQLYTVLDRYRLLSDRVTVLPTDVARNPGILTRFQGDVDTTIEADSVIVSCEDTGRYKILGYSDFVTQGYSIENGTFEIAGLAYEKNLTEAICYVASDSAPVVGILQGHGELNEDALVTFIGFLQSNGYDYRMITLAEDALLAGVDVLLIADPQKDLGDDEIACVKAYAEGGGSLFVMRDYTDPLDLPNYRSLLRSYGVEPLAGVVIASEEDAGSYYGEPLYLMPYYCDLELTAPLKQGHMDVLLLAGASAFESPAQTDASLSAAAVLKSGPHAYLRDPSDGSAGIEQQPNDRVGEMTLAVLSARMHATGNVSRLFAIGNSTVFTDSYMYQRTYNEEFLLQVMGELAPQKAVSLDIKASTAFHPGLKAGSQTIGLVLLTAVPLLALLCGLVLLLPRRNR